ncbi:MAG: M12 family metallopeptidase [Nitrosopumilus sp.]
MLKDSHGQHYCCVPTTFLREFGSRVSNNRARLIRVAEKKWVNGTILHYCFLDNIPQLIAANNDAQKEVVKKAFDLWADIEIGIKFKQVFSPEDAEIKIGFDHNDGSWSYVGRDVLDKEQTMNFGWDLTQPGEINTAIHEIGHTLGFPHEHQNPNAGIVWDEEAVYAELAGPPNFWSRQDTFWNIIRKISPDTVEGTKWDPNSIMHYPFGPGLIREPQKYQNGLCPEPGLSEKDITQARIFYPEITESEFEELGILESNLLAIKPGQQKNFAIKPKSSRNYSFRTFGGSDTVMVIFEQDGDELHYIKGDDDSGTDLNANFTIRLIKDRKYILRIRLYYNFSNNDTAVMMW